MAYSVLLGSTNVHMPAAVRKGLRDARAVVFLCENDSKDVSGVTRGRATGLPQPCGNRLMSRILS